MSDRALVAQDIPRLPPAGTGLGLVRNTEQLQAARRQHRLEAPRSPVSWLLEQGVIGTQDVERARPMLRPGEPLEMTLLRRGKIDREALDLARAASLSVPFVDVKRFRRDPKAVATIEASWARTHEVLPLCFDGPVLVAACADPSDVELEQILGFTLNRIVELVMARPDDLQRAIVAAYGPSEDAPTQRLL